MFFVVLKTYAWYEVSWNMYPEQHLILQVRQSFNFEAGHLFSSIKVNGLFCRKILVIYRGLGGCICIFVGRNTSLPLLTISASAHRKVFTPKTSQENFPSTLSEFPRIHLLPVSNFHGA